MHIINQYRPGNKILTLIFGVILTALILFTPNKTHAYGYNWDISSFDTEITVQENGTLHIKETIIADYSREKHHGIFRTIPVEYGDATGNKLKLRYKINSVTDEKGNDWWYEESRTGEYVKIKAGDPDKYQNNLTTFIIDYEIVRAVSHQFDDHDEIYWNSTGDEWEVPIKKASTTIHFPNKVNSDDLRATCYTGKYGSSEQECSSTITGNTISYKTFEGLNSREGLTIVAGFPKGIVQPPTSTQQVIWFLTDNWPYALPVLTFIILYYLWATRGKDPKINRDTVMPIYKPPKGITPSEAGTLIDERVDMHDITAVIVDMAVRGYIKIIETTEKKLLFDTKEYTFEKLKDFQDDPELQEHERKTLKAIFGTGTTTKTKLSELKNKFYQDLPGIRSAIYEQLVSKKYFPRNPDKTRKLYSSIGSALIFLPIFAFGLFFGFTLSIAFPIGIALSGVIILIFSRYMPAKTKKGVEIYYKILGLEEFINTAEKDRIKFQEKENIFMQLLPFAMAFNLADKWSKAFEGLLKTPPDWYQSSDPNFATNFNTFYFISTLNHMSQDMSTAMASRPRSSGSGGAWSGGSGFSGGFSGGGFGGGGGGSW
jgi:uncharacterized membrane protein